MLYIYMVSIFYYKTFRVHIRSREVIGTLHFVFIIMCVLYYLSDIFNFLHPFVKNLIKNKYLNIKS